MEAEEIYINQTSMQAAAVKDEQRGTPANRKGVDDPNYANIPVILRKQDHPKGSHSPSKSEARSRPSSDSAQCLHKAFTSLYILLALISIILLVWVLVKNSVMSQELLVLKMEISNVSISTREWEVGQRKGWSYVKQSLSNAKQSIDLANHITQIKTQLQQISVVLKKMQNPQPTQSTRASETPGAGRPPGPASGTRAPPSGGFGEPRRAARPAPPARRACAHGAVYGAVKQLGRAAARSSRATAEV
uniref:Mast cell expressed membrane protein 1 n=1 Tax=Myotis myotis TaxID=51298 RepID=A0A7J7XI80_MYOMY|nr:mast cell expressed membrane protein 1 [Myotis myotis]